MLNSVRDWISFVVGFVSLGATFYFGRDPRLSSRETVVSLKVCGIEWTRSRRDQFQS